jgi:hypothetical protein
MLYRKNLATPFQTGPSNRPQNATTDDEDAKFCGIAIRSSLKRVGDPAPNASIPFQGVFVLRVPELHIDSDKM